jgi:hypothetical protein
MYWKSYMYTNHVWILIQVLLLTKQGQISIARSWWQWSQVLMAMKPVTRYPASIKGLESKLTSLQHQLVSKSVSNYSSSCTWKTLSSTRVGFQKVCFSTIMQDQKQIQCKIGEHQNWVGDRGIVSYFKCVISIVASGLSFFSKTIQQLLNSQT